ncbi:dienelactone hydrolase family protein [Desulfosporosinus sp.]|uniref:dienelactone hydrolase family protein n=1 Tax=Desulfosporosinus sp. TaxID=157907 RepID=UPI0025BA213A|nr:dienelactone hydrolase family protein [Desulfosporosinus sp.]MBC2726084.1 dienelactone hydrolase family protein [Desulfosporosinus sp.]
MLNNIRGNKSVIIVLHEIYGINPHIKWVCEHYLEAGYDVLCPNFIKSEIGYFDYNREEEAYQYFVNHVGFPHMVDEIGKILIKSRAAYNNIVLLGFSVGATAAWICSEKGNTADEVICYYGSRIRDYQNITPRCSTLLIFAKEEKSFNVSKLTNVFEEKKSVNVSVLDGKHGFSDPFSKNFNEQSQKRALKLVDEFLIRGRNVAPPDSVL